MEAQARMKGQAARRVSWRDGLLLFAAMLASKPCVTATALSSGLSSISLCVTDKATSSVWYLTDLTAPLPGQAVSEEQYLQGRLVLLGGVVPSPTIEIVAADPRWSVHDGRVVANGSIHWSTSAHRRAAAYSEALEGLLSRADLSSSRLFAVIPIGLAGSSTDSKLKGLHVIPGSRDTAPHPSGQSAAHSRVSARTATEGGWVGVLMSMRAPAVPKLWPIVSSALRERGGAGRGQKAGRRGAEAGVSKDPGARGAPRQDIEMVMVTQIVRFVLSLQRFRVRVVDEESFFVSAHALHQKRRAVPGGDEHPDLRDGALRSDLPKAYVSEVVYGHRLLVSVNISVPVDPSQVPEQLDSVGQLLLRVITRDVDASAFDSMFPGVSLFARLRWDPDIQPPEEVIRRMQDMRDVFYGDSSVRGAAPGGGGSNGQHTWGRADEDEGYYNHTLHTCKRGSFRRSIHGRGVKGRWAEMGNSASCPADEWPSLRDPGASWVLRGGGAQELLDKIGAWQTAMTLSKAAALQAVALSMQVRREVGAGDASWALSQLEAFNLTSLSVPHENTSSQQKAAISAVRQRLRDRSLLEYQTTTCMQSSVVPLPLMLALGDLLVFLSLSLLVVFCAWVYLLSGYVIARLSHLVRLPGFVQVRPVPLRIFLLSFGTGGTARTGEQPVPM